MTLITLYFTGMSTFSSGIKLLIDGYLHSTFYILNSEILQFPTKFLHQLLRLLTQLLRHGDIHRDILIPSPCMMQSCNPKIFEFKLLSWLCSFWDHQFFLSIECINLNLVAERGLYK